MKRVLVLALLALLIPTGTFGALSDATDNQASTFTAAADFGPCGDLNLTATADAAVDEKNPGTNYGSSTTLRVYPSSTVSAAANERVFVSFPDVTVDAGCALASATLRLYASAIDGGRSLNVWQAGGAWAESAVTWASQPSTTGSAAGFTVAAGWNSVDVTALVAAQIAATNNGFAVIDPFEDTTGYGPHVFGSREGSYPPQLIVTFTGS